MISLKFRVDSKNSIEYLFLTKAVQMITVAEEVSKDFQRVSSGATDCYEAYDRFESAIAGTDFSMLSNPGTCGQMLAEDSLKWFIMAVSTVSSVFREISLCAEVMESISAAEADSYAKSLNAARGSLAYGLLDGMGVLGHLTAEELSGDIIATEGITAFCCDRFYGNHLLMLDFLYSNYLNNPPIVPLRFEFPDVWVDFCDFVAEAEFGNEILDYGDLLYLPDVKAICNNLVPIDDTLLETLRDRETNACLPVKLFPYKFSRFVEALPDKHSDLILKYEKVLSEELIDKALQTGITKEFIKSLQEAPSLQSVYGQTAAISLTELIGEETHLFG